MKKCHSLLIKSKRSFGNNDTVSLYFECVDDTVIVHRYYYSYDEFIKFLDSSDNFIKGQKIILSIKESITSMSFNELTKALNLFITKKYNRNILKTYQNEYAFGIRSAKKEKLIEKINDFFYRYQINIDMEKSKFNGEFKRIIDELYDLYPIAENNQNPESCIHKDYEKLDENYEFRIYDVGQANCSALIKYKDERKHDYDVVTVFDLGIEHKKRNSKLNEMINKINEKTTIIISHFHSDHINNILNFDLSKTCRWVFPDYLPKSFKANIPGLVLLRIVTWKSHHTQIKRYKLSHHSLSNYLEIYQNINPTKNEKNSSMINAKGIISSIVLNDKKILIPADVLYKDFPNKVFKHKYSHVIIPHHCGVYQGNGLNNCIINNILSCKCAYILSGKNSYGHANINHLNLYNPKSIRKFFGSSIYDSSKNKVSICCSSVKSKYIGIKY